MGLLSSLLNLDPVLECNKTVRGYRNTNCICGISELQPWQQNFGIQGTTNLISTSSCYFKWRVMFQYHTLNGLDTKYLVKVIVLVSKTNWSELKSVESNSNATEVKFQRTLRFNQNRHGPAQQYRNLIGNLRFENLLINYKCEGLHRSQLNYGYETVKKWSYDPKYETCPRPLPRLFPYEELANDILLFCGLLREVVEFHETLSKLRRTNLSSH